MKTIKCLSIILLISFISLSCNKSENDYPLPCSGDCTTNYKVVYLGDTLTKNQNGIWEIEYAGLNYFQVSGKLSELNERYVINGVPLIEANFDSDYWVLFDTLRFQIPMYSYLGWFNDQSMNTPISIGTYTYTMANLIDLHPPLNIVGYQIPKYFCWECPYAPTIVGVHSKYNYRPTCNVLLDDEMIGDTINMFIETLFNSDIGENEIIVDSLKIFIK
tara:strand:- start:319 stop:972 length:654 start_codon:yes stop_codon:yes gene_type:complete